MTLEVRPGTTPRGAVETAVGTAGKAAGDAPAPAARILVAGVGNIFLRDDGFGPEVARHLAAAADRALPGMLAVDYGIRGMHLAYDLLAGVDVLVLVDTVPAGAAPPDGPPGASIAATAEDAGPGSIRVLRVRPEDLDGASALDPHGMDPVAVLGRLRSLGGELPLTDVVGCVPADLTEGIGLSAAVAAAVPQAIAAVVDLVRNNAVPEPNPVPEPDLEDPPCA